MVQCGVLALQFRSFRIGHQPRPLTGFVRFLVRVPSALLQRAHARGKQGAQGQREPALRRRQFHERTAVSS